MITGQPAIESHLTNPSWEDPVPGSPQYNFIHEWMPEVSLFGGRGTRKTGHLVYNNAISATILNPGCVSYLTEQTNQMLADILEPVIKDFINPDLYHISGSVAHGSGQINWHDTGSITRLRSRQAKKKSDYPPFRGPSAPGGIGHDELCIDNDPIDDERNVILISMAMLRGKGGNLKSMKNTSTPRKTWVYDHFSKYGIVENGIRSQYSTNGRACAFYSITKEVDRELYDLLSTQYGETFAKQELEAWWLDAKGRVWEQFSDVGLREDALMWPHSNIHWADGIHPDTDNHPLILGVDLGAVESSWTLHQMYPAIDRIGGRVFDGNIMVAIAEWTPVGESAAKVLNEVAQYCNPHVPLETWVGHDIATPGGAYSDAPEYIFHQRGWGRSIRTHSGLYTFQKHAQSIAADAAICNIIGERRYCVSKNLRTFAEQDPPRGILQVFEKDSWPTHGNHIFRKNKTEGTLNLEDSRDSFLYPVSGVFPPPVGPTEIGLGKR